MGIIPISGIREERAVGQDKEPLIAIFKLLGITTNSGIHEERTVGQNIEPQVAISKLPEIIPNSNIISKHLSIAVKFLYSSILKGRAPDVNSTNTVQQSGRNKDRAAGKQRRLQLE